MHTSCLYADYENLCKNAGVTLDHLSVSTTSAAHNAVGALSMVTITQHPANNAGSVALSLGAVVGAVGFVATVLQ